MEKEIKTKLLAAISFTPDCQNKWDFDGSLITISSRGYDREKKSFFVGYYLGNDDYDIVIIEDELFDEDFDVLKVKVKQWYKDHMVEALEKALKMIREQDVKKELIVCPEQKKELSVKECLTSLENLFKSYKKDSEFNYQLSVSDSPFNQLKKLTLWRPIKDYFEEYHDWVLVQFKEKDTDFMPIPIVAEYRKHKKKWFPHEEDNSLINYLNDVCEPVAFMQIPHYKENN